MTAHTEEDKGGVLLNSYKLSLRIYSNHFKIPCVFCSFNKQEIMEIFDLTKKEFIITFIVYNQKWLTNLKPIINVYHKLIFIQNQVLICHNVINNIFLIKYHADYYRLDLNILSENNNYKIKCKKYLYKLKIFFS